MRMPPLRQRLEGCQQSRHASRWSLERLKDPIARRLTKHSPLILDGAFATELERRGQNLQHSLWSARLLMDAPEAIRDLHLTYLRAGVDCITSVGYQASVPGFMACGFSPAEARELYLDSIRIPLQARDDFVRESGGPEPLVAASIGPYGAYLADGSEYRGAYSASAAEIENFHRQRIELINELAEQGAAPDLIAIETIPSLDEALILAGILESCVTQPAWLAFSCRDAERNCEGQLIEVCTQALDACPAIVAVGVNCTSPEHMPALIGRMAKVTSKPILAYPNSGEVYDPKERSWGGQNIFANLEDAATLWVSAGASLLGGCCRTGPKDIARLVRWRDSLL